MIIAHISQIELSNLEDSGRAQVTLEPASDGIVSHALVFEAEVTTLRQALTEQHNRMAGEIAMLHRTIDHMTLREMAEHDAATTRAPAHLPAVDRDALCLTLLTDDQAVMTLDRIKESRRLSYVASIFSSVPE